MTIQLSKESLMRSKKMKTLAAGLLVAGMMAASVLASSEPAHAATTFTVNNKGDGSDANLADGLCKTSSGVCTLRAAIEQANTTSGADTINFNIPGDLQLILPNSGLPSITDQVTIDGYTQPGAKANTLAKGDDAVLKVVLRGTNAGSDGLRIQADNTVVRGLALTSSASNGVSINEAQGVRIEGNFIGTENGSGNQQGQGNAGRGVAIDGSQGSGANVVGGASPASRNVISGNRDDGVKISGGSSGNKVLGNLIGTNRDGTVDLGNAFEGVNISGGDTNVVGDGTSEAANTIAFNGREGVSINLNDANGNRVLSNSIFSNNGLGIATCQNPNDPGDADFGPNGCQNYPELNFAVASGSQTFVSGTLDSTPSKTFKVQVFSSLQKDPSGFGEGQTFLGEKEVTTDASGKASFLLAAPKATAVGSFVTATATSASGDTSEFSQGKVAVPLKKKKHKRH